MGPAFCGVAGDAADNAVIDQMFASANSHFGKSADIVIANAGRGLGGTVKDADLSEFEDVVKVNLCGTLALLQKAAQLMVATQHDFPNTAADIVVVGSVVPVQCGLRFHQICRTCAGRRSAARSRPERGARLIG
jgi:NAD(P)-dependent dehydrogenase (short-subunit alcohol dehydrogenase family)